MRKVRSDRGRLNFLYERLEWVNHLFFSIPGPVYGKIGGSTNVKPDRIIEILDRKFRIEQQIKQIEERKAVMDSFLLSLTDKENHCFKLYYFMDLSQFETACKMGISQQAVSQKLANIEKKWNKDY